MKQILISILFLTLISSCGKKDFEGIRTDEKIKKLTNAYSEQLTGSKNGWIGYLFPKGGGSYTFKFNFNNKNRVSTFASIDKQKSETAKESSYRLAADQVISLYFDTYSYLHQLADPDERKSGGMRGGGLLSDFEFSILKANSDTIRMIGNHNGSDLILVKATEQEGDDFVKKAYALNDKIGEIDQFPHYYKQISINNKPYGLIINHETSSICFYFEENGNFKSFITEYATSANGITLRKPFLANGLLIQEINDFRIDKSNGFAKININGNSESEIKQLEKPLIIDKDAPRRMYLIDKIHRSNSGFTINGKIDALNLSSIINFAGLYYIPRRYIDPYDGLLVVFDEGSSVGPIFNTLYNNDGILHFRPFTLLSGVNPGPEAEQVIIKQNNIWFNPDGFHVFQTSSNSFDFVNSKDSKTWIRFK